MPTYDFQCATCKTDDGGPFEFEAFVQHIGGTEACRRCEGPTERVWRLGNHHIGSSCFPYVTKNLTPDGSPIEVTSERHLQQLCKQFGKTHRPDAAWITKEYLGYDPLTGQQRYSEGSKLGMPGVWY